MIELTPERSAGMQALLADSRDRERSAVSNRELRAETVVGGAFLLVAIAIAIGFDTPREFSLTAAALVFITLLAASLVTFEVGAVITWPAQVAFVPSLFMLPLQYVPLIVAVTLVAGRLILAGRGMTPKRALMAFGDSWFAIGPVLVLIAAGSPAATEVGAVTLILALLAQFVAESASSRVREALHGGATLREQLAESVWIYTVDTLLAPVGFAIALAAEESLAADLLALPLFAVLAFLARDRRQRIDSVLALSDAYRGTARLLHSVVSYDDAYTGSHSRGVTELAAQVGERLGLTPSQRHKVEFGALLHDVGKIAISKSIINKPASLTDEEWALMRTHTVEGQRMLDQVGGMMSEVGLIIRWSHECYDGTGYPDGIKGEAIPIESRIIFCCDAFSAMTTDRPYRGAVSEWEALRELRAAAGTQFDPAVVDAVIAALTSDPGRTS